MLKNTELVFEDAVNGFLTVHKNKYKRLDTKYGFGIYDANMPKDTVRVIVSGGGGFGPMWLGFVGKGISDAAVSGYFAAAPNAYTLYEMAKKISSDKGIIFITNNFMGDYLNNDMAVELLEHEGIRAKAIYVTDDIFSADISEKNNRTGLSGIGQICKLAVNAAYKGMSLEGIYDLCIKANENLVSLSMRWDDKYLYMGEGIAGEKYKIVRDFKTLKYSMEIGCELLVNEVKLHKDSKLYISISSNRDVCYTVEHMLIHYCADYMQKRKLEIQGCSVGTYFDNFSGQGAIISLMACDKEMGNLLEVVSGNGFEI